MKSHLLTELSEINARIHSKEVALAELRSSPHFYGQETFINCIEAEWAVLQMKRRVFGEAVEVGP